MESRTRLELINSEFLMLSSDHKQTELNNLDKTLADWSRNVGTGGITYHFNTQQVFDEKSQVTANDIHAVVNTKLPNINPTIKQYIENYANQNGFGSISQTATKKVAQHNNHVILDNKKKRVNERYDFIANKDGSVTFVERFYMYEYQNVSIVRDPNRSNKYIKYPAISSNQSDRPILIGVTTSLIKPTEDNGINHTLFSDKILFADPAAENLFLPNEDLGIVETRYDKTVEEIHEELNGEIQLHVDHKSPQPFAPHDLYIPKPPASPVIPPSLSRETPKPILAIPPIGENPVEPLPNAQTLGQRITGFFKRHAVATAILSVIGIGAAAGLAIALTGGLAALPLAGALVGIVAKAGLASALTTTVIGAIGAGIGVVAGGIVAGIGGAIGAVGGAIARAIRSSKNNSVGPEPQAQQPVRGASPRPPSQGGATFDILRGLPQTFPAAPGPVNSNATIPGTTYGVTPKSSPIPISNPERSFEEFKKTLADKFSEGKQEVFEDSETVEKFLTDQKRNNPKVFTDRVNELLEQYEKDDHRADHFIEYLEKDPLFTQNIPSSTSSSPSRSLR